MNEPLILENLMEIRDTLNGIEESPDGGIIAQFGCCPVRLPDELAPQLKNLVGHNVGVLLLDGFHVRNLDADAEARR